MSKKSPVRHSVVYTSRVWFSPRNLFGHSECLVQPCAYCLRFAGVAGTTQDRLVRSELLRPYNKCDRHGASFGGEDYKREAAISTLGGISRLNVFGERNARILAHLGSTKPHRLLSSLRVSPSGLPKSALNASSSRSLHSPCCDEWMICTSRSRLMSHGH